jgi:hypothetical protein
MQGPCGVEISRRDLVDLERCYELLGGLTRGQDIGPIESLSEEEATAILDLARVVAHSVERKAAPLVSFSMGRALASVEVDARLAAIRDAVARIERGSTETSTDA